MTVLELKEELENLPDSMDNAEVTLEQNQDGWPTSSVQGVSFINLQEIRLAIPNRKALDFYHDGDCF